MGQNSGVSGRAIVIGGSMSGLFTCLLLRRIGWDAHIFERVDTELAGRGAGIVTHPELFQAMGRAGVDADEKGMGVSVTHRRTYGHDGNVVGERDYPQVLTAWDHIYALARKEVPDSHYHKGKNLVSFEQKNGVVKAIFDDGLRDRLRKGIPLEAHS